MTTTENAAHAGLDNYGYVANWVTRAVPSGAACRILDYGCGQGRTVQMLRERDHEACGCDAFVQTGRPPCEYVLNPAWFGDVIRDMPDGKIPYPSESFDIVTNNQVMEHVENLELTLTEIHRVLKPGGLLLSLFPARSVWREGHCGVAFLHWFPKGSRARFYYALFWRALGFGYHKQKLGSVSAWARNRCRYLDEQTFYRPMREIHRLYGRYFVNLRHMEAAYLRERFGRRVPVLAKLPDTLLDGVVRAAAGCVFSCEKPSA